MWRSGDLVDFAMNDSPVRGFVKEDWPADGAQFVRVHVVEEDLDFALEPDELLLVSTLDQRLGIDPNDDIPYKRWIEEEAHG